MANYTLSYSEEAKGFPSFYSFTPENMVGVNNYFYSFKKGNLYRHNVNENRNVFYGEQSYSSIKTTFNDVVLENKLFKTLTLQGNSSWSASLSSDTTNVGYMENNWFSKKEQTFFAFIRNSIGITTNDISLLRSTNGIGNCTSINYSNISAVEINFSINPLVAVGNISVGDIVFFTQGFAGIVTQIITDYPNGINKLIINASNSVVNFAQNQTSFVAYYKNIVAESHGILGHYCTVELTNSSTGKVELFAIQSEVMKSFP